MNIPAPFIRRPAGTTLLTVGIVLAGVAAFKLLPVAPLPPVDFPTIAVAASLPGASPETMATSVATPLERQFARIAGVTEITSVSNLGATSVTMQFDLSRDINGAARDVQAAINAARGYLPSNLPRPPAYRKINPADAPIMILSLTSDAIGTEKMYDYASTILAQKLSQVEGIGQVFVGGSSLPAVRVDLNPTALNKYGIGLDEVRGVLQATNANRPKGQLSDAARTWEISANDQIRTADQYLPLVVAYRNGTAVRLSDVADVQDSVEDLRAAGLANGKPAVLVVMFRQPGANIIETVDRVRALLPQLEASLPGAVQLAIAMDRSPVIRASLREVEITLLLSSLLVVLVVFLFLQSFRAAVIPTVAVAVSLIGTFGLMYLFGYNLDNLSLMALTIATGFVVDDAIVVLENVSRHMEGGTPPLEAALLGAREVSFTVLSMSTSLIAVFTPILLMGGMIGRLFREFAVTLSMAVGVSLLVSLTTTPMMCAYILKPGAQTGRFQKAGERAFDRMRKGYDRSLSWALRHPRFMILLTAATVAVTVFLYATVPKGFFPQQDNGRLVGGIQAAQDISFQSMREKLAMVEGIIRKDPAVDTVIAFTGGGGAGGSTVNTGRMFIGLKDPSERKLTADEVISRLRGKLARVPGAMTGLQPVQDIRVGGRISNAQYQYTIQGDNLKDLTAWAPRVEREMRALPELADVSSDWQDRGLEARLTIDRDTAARLGITLQAIDDALYDAFGQRQVSINYTLLNQYHVVMEAAPRFWRDPDTLKDIYVRTAAGGEAPLSVFTHFEPAPALLAVNHQNQFPAATVSFNLAPGVSLGSAVTAIDAAARRMRLPTTVRGSFQGTAQAFQEALANQPLLILAALVTVYIVLGVLYESYVHPVTILSTLPSAGVGALLALLLTGTEFTIISLIGIILLIGIVKKNAILMIDFALQAERMEGKGSADAIYEACLLRFRPIMMTTMAALLGALPLAVGHGVGGELRRPLGISIVGGLIFSQMLTLYTTPVIYLYLDRFRLWFAGRKAVLLRRLPIAAIALLIAVTSACTVGPDYRRPAPLPPAAKAEIPPAYLEAVEWKVAQPKDHLLREDWWKLFSIPELDALEGQVAAANQDVAAAEANYRQAVALVRSARSGYYPTVTAGASVTRFSGRPSGGGGASATVSGSPSGAGARGASTSYMLPIDFSWEIDLWGRVRRSVESARASAQASRADLASALLSAQALLAQDYFLLRTIDAHKKVLEETIAGYQKTLQLTKNRYNAGVASRADVLQAETQLKSAQVQSIDLEVQRAQLSHAMAILLGKPPSAFSVPYAPLAAPPPVIPTGVPSNLLERRPDIAAAERAVAAANARIGVAKAAYYPTVSLSAAAGFAAASSAKWLTWPASFWSVGPAASEVLFEGGLRRAQTEEARAVYDAQVAAYRQTVLTGFREVEDSLAALRVLEEEARVQQEALEAARRTVEITLNQYKAGTVSYLNVIVVQAIALSNEQTALDIFGRRMDASVSLVKALGGGWDASSLR